MVSNLSTGETFPEIACCDSKTGLGLDLHQLDVHLNLTIYFSPLGDIFPAFWLVLNF